MRFTILGCGSSGGVPRVGQGWGACDPKDKRNLRRRCSALVERCGPEGRTSVLIDTSPDLRWQLIDAGVQSLDAVFLTHPHADHTHGIDDLRPLTLALGRRIDVYMDRFTAADVLRKFDYIFATPEKSSYPPIANARYIEPCKPVEIVGAGGDVTLMPLELIHGDISALGFRIGGLAYTPDLNDIPAATLPLLADLDVWVVDTLRYQHHPSHFCLEEALAWIARLKPRRAVLTNLHTDMDYEALSRQLPRGVEVAVDGMEIAAVP